MPYEEIWHYGILGMKWGVRRDRKVGTTPSSNGGSKLSKWAQRKEKEKQARADRASAIKRLDTMSDEELKARVNRINLEKQYKEYVDKLYPQKKSAVRSFLQKAAGQLLTNVVNKTTEQIATNIAAKLKKDEKDKITKTKIKDVTKVGDKALKEAIQRLNQEKMYRNLNNNP